MKRFTISFIIFLSFFSCLALGQVADDPHALDLRYLAYIFSHIPDGQAEAKRLNEQFKMNLDSRALAHFVLEEDHPEIETLKKYLTEALKGAQYFRKIVGQKPEDPLSESEYLILNITAYRMRSEIKVWIKKDLLPIEAEYLKSVSGFSSRNIGLFDSKKAYEATLALLHYEGVKIVHQDAYSKEDWKIEISP